MMPSAIDRLKLFLRAPGLGILTLSSGGEQATKLLKSLYSTEDTAAAVAQWQRSLERIASTNTILIGIPSDSGAGIVRGSNFGPIGIRQAYLRRFGGYPDSVLDIGDVVCVPQLLHDDMLNEAQIESVRMALYGSSIEPFPVSPLSIAEQAIGAILELNAGAKIIMLGGDHGVTWPVMRNLYQTHGEALAVLQIDAHTDLGADRFGVKHCFNTWAYHTAQLIPNRVIQVGLRASTKSKEQWLAERPVVQFWASEILADENTAFDKIIESITSLTPSKLYISNDIDGTDITFAPATGTPAPGGLTPAFIHRLLARVCQQFEVVGGDLVEVAPPLSGAQDYATEPTCELAGKYLHSLLRGAST